MPVPVIFTFARIAVAALLFWALANHSPNYYVILRWAVFFVAAFGVYRIYIQKDKEWLFVFLHLAIVVVFNPFTPLHLERSVWGVINVITGLFIFFTLLFIDNEPLTQFFGSKAGKKTILILSIPIGLGLVLLGGVIIRYAAENFIDGIQLKLYSKRGQAQVIKVKHRLESSESDEGGGQIFDEFLVEYAFQIEGKEFTGGGTLSLHEVRESYGDRFDGLYKEEVVLSRDEGLPIEINYEPNNPSNNRAVESVHGFGGNVIDVPTKCKRVGLRLTYR